MIDPLWERDFADHPSRLNGLTRRSAAERLSPSRTRDYVHARIHMFRQINGACVRRACCLGITDRLPGRRPKDDISNT